jgi:hypothetical protein
MTGNSVHQCRCRTCRQIGAHPTKKLHAAMNAFFHSLSARQKLWYLGLEALQGGPGSERGLSLIFGCQPQLMRSARAQLAKMEDRFARSAERPNGPVQGPRPDDKATVAFSFRNGEAEKIAREKIGRSVPLSIYTGKMAGFASTSFFMGQQTK